MSLKIGNHFGLDRRSKGVKQGVEDKRNIGKCTESDQLGSTYANTSPEN